MMHDVHTQSNPGLPWQKQHSIRVELFTSDLDLNLRHKQKHCYIRSIAQIGAETWTLENRWEIPLKVSKCGAGEEWKKLIGWIM
jgi:hypothetical protein